MGGVSVNSGGIEAPGAGSLLSPVCRNSSPRAARPCTKPGLKAGLKSRTPPPAAPPETSTQHVNPSSCHLINGLGHRHVSCDGVARFDPGYHRRAQFQAVAGIGLGGPRNPASGHAHAVHGGLHTLQGRAEIDHDADPLSYLIGTRPPSLNCYDLNRVQVVQNHSTACANVIEARA